MASKIEWTGETWNPTVGCSLVSPGCTHCYAMKMANRLESMAHGDERHPLEHYRGSTKVVNSKPVWTGQVNVAPDHILLKPLSWKKPRRIFVNSMSDLFHEDAPDEWIDEVFAVMALCPQHTFQILTKRSKRMREYCENVTASRLQVAMESLPLTDPWAVAWPLPNVWLGVSCEDQTRAEERIPDLMHTPAAVRFVSAEPLLGPIDFEDVASPKECDCSPAHTPYLNALSGSIFCNGCCEGPERINVKLDWIIVGGESGEKARPMHPDWARDIRNQCAEAGTAFFFKQWGEWAPGENCGDTPTRTERTATWWSDKWLFDTITPRESQEGHIDDECDLYRIGKKRAGRHLDGVIHDAMPKMRKD